MQIDIQEAARLTGKNGATIRRLTKKPASKPYVKVVAGKLLIERDYLFNNYPPIQAVNEPVYANAQEPIQSIDKSLLEAKEQTIQILRQDIEGKEKTIAQLLERTREQNIIIQSIQDKIKALPAPADHRTTSDGYSPFEKGAIACLVAILLSLLYYLFFA